MAANSEFLLFGGSGDIAQADALVGFNNSIESGVEMLIRSKRYAVVSPAADVVGKRLFIQGRHREGAALSITPTADGRELPALTRSFASFPSATGDDENQFTFLVPLARVRLSGTYSTGVRATTFGFVIRAFMPESEFHIESVDIEAHPLSVSRGRRVSD